MTSKDKNVYMYPFPQKARFFSLTNINAKVLYKILTNTIQEQLKGIAHHNPRGFSPGMNGQLNYLEKLLVQLTILIALQRKIIPVSRDAEKSVAKMSYPFLVKFSVT